MSVIHSQALREAAEQAMPDNWGFDADLFHELVTPSIVLTLLDERERNQQYIKRRDQENEEIALTVGKLRVELEAAEKRIAELEAEPVSQTYKLNELSGNSPVTPDGWQLVPKEPTVAMNKAGWAAINEHDEINPTYRAMLAAAPQQDVRLALEIGMSRYAGAMQKLVDSGD